MNAEVPIQNRFDVYRAVTDKIVAAIEAGAGEFVMPWHGSGIAKPQNAVTRMDYHGINVIALWAQAHAAGYGSGYWASYKQWQSVGAQVVKGAKGAIVVFFKEIELERQDDEAEPSTRLFARASRVFNAAQVAGWTPAEERDRPPTAQILKEVEEFIVGTRAIIEDRGSCACYRIDTDTIEMPAIERFVGSPTCSATEAYNATLLHEIVHWSGAAHRLDRGFKGERTREWLAAEELVAEIGAAFLCADLSVTNEPRPDHAAYVASWLKLLKDDPRAIFAAARLANQAASYLHELSAANA